MNSLTIVEKDGPRVDTRELAERLGNEHRSTFKLVRDFKADFECLGKVRFEIAPSPDSRTGQKARFALLNEDQAYLLLTFSRNTPKVRELKVKLVQAFREARQSRDITVAEYLPSYHALHDVAHEKCGGSANERFVHMNLNKLVNKAVGIEAGERTGLPIGHRSMLVVAQTVAANQMAASVDHHDGYEKAKRALGDLGRVLEGPRKKRLPHAA